MQQFIPQSRSLRLQACVFFMAGLIGSAMSMGQLAPTMTPPAPAAAGMPGAPIKPAVAVTPATQPSVEAVQAAIDAKDYSGATKLAAKVLALKGPAAAGISRFQVTMLKGDAQAGMKSISAAVMTYKSAIKETKDVKEIALAKWTAELFHTANSTTYTPKLIAVGGAKRGPFDLMVTEQRKDAFGALLDDSLSTLEPKLKVASISQSLPQIWPVLQQVIDLDQLDVIANGSDDKTTTLSSSLLEHSRNLLSNALKEYWARVGDIDSHANLTTVVPTQVYVNNTLVTQNVTKKNGLSDANKSYLKDAITTAQKIHDAATTFMSVAKTDQGWNTILADSDRVAGKASDVLNADYGTSTTSGTTDTTTGGYGIPSGNTFGGGTVGVGTGTGTGNGTGTGTNTQATPGGTNINAQNTQQVPAPKRSNAPTKKTGN